MPLARQRSCISTPTDLLHESARQAQLKVDHACQQMDSAREVAPSIAVTLKKIRSSLAPSNAVFDFDAQSCQGAIGLLIVIAQGFSRQLFLWRDAVGMNFGDALIALVG